MKKEYPDFEGTSLKFGNDLELLIATILSAQCTDIRVNIVTKHLFERYKTVEDYAEADLEEIEAIVKSTGFYHRKSQFIKRLAQKLIRDFNSKIPRSIEEMTKLPGVARKTANIVLCHAFSIIEGVAVDTHVKRLTRRMHLTNQNNPEKIERDLMSLFLKEQWCELSSLLITHGRNTCSARSPKCKKCMISDLCPSAILGEK